MRQALATSTVAVVEEGPFLGLHMETYRNGGPDGPVSAVELHGYQFPVRDLRTRPLLAEEETHWQYLLRQRQFHPRLREIGTEMRVTLLELQAIMQSLPIPGLNVAQTSNLTSDVRQILGNYAPAYAAELAEMARLETQIHRLVAELRHLEERF